MIYFSLGGFLTRDSMFSVCYLLMNHKNHFSLLKLLVASCEHFLIQFGYRRNNVVYKNRVLISCLCVMRTEYYLS